MSAPDAAEPRMSEAGRLSGIFWEPKPVFQDLAAKPRFWVPLILLTLVSLVYVVAFTSRVGYENMIRRQMETNSRVQELSAEQQEQAIEMGLKFAVPMGYASAALGMGIGSLLIAAILLACFNFLGGAELKFKQAFSITCYSFLPSGLASILALVVMYLKDPADFDIQNPLPVHLGAFFSQQDTAAWLRTLATNVNLFTIWTILLLALGFSVAAKRVSFTKALVLILLPWSVVVVGQVAYAALMG
jgi:hypothetical protein